MASVPPQLAGPTFAHAGSSSQAADTSTTPIHKRTYQACIPCRRRKVRCDLGPVDDPQDPPCVRCRRESKECFFSATRRKRKADGGEDEFGEDEHTNDDYAARNARRKSVRANGSLSGHEGNPQHARRSMTAGSLSANSPGNDYGLTHDRSFQEPNTYSQNAGDSRIEESQDQEVTNERAAELFQSPINIPGDALHLLLKASGQSETIQRRDTISSGRLPASHSIRGLATAAAAATAQKNYDATTPEHRQRQGGQIYPSNIDPAIAGDGSDTSRYSVPQETLKTWSRLRFVRAGWFTAREAVAYIDYFYDYLAPLTPISPPAFRSHAAHFALLSDEPMLTVTMLTIASRYMKIPGAGGQTRSFMIHERLWTYLQNMITRMFWGQEQFGGGFCGAGSRRLGYLNSGKGGLRNLGTIESLLLLSEFHPRSMHFPPRDDDDDILAPAEDEVNAHPTTDEKTQDITPSGESTMAGWSEPALRSDRMCWSLIGTSYALAYELGIFGTYSDGTQSVDGRVNRQQSGSPAHRQRADRIERLLYIYITQASGRFGLPSMYSDHISSFNTSSLKDGSITVDSAILRDPVDKTQQSWVELMTIMKACNDQLFTTKAQTSSLIQSGEYMAHLQNLQPLLQSWHQAFERLEVPKYPRLVLSIEYHYICLYINSLALQAVLEQWTTKANAAAPSESPQSPASTTSSSFAGLYSRNEHFIGEVIESSRTVLRHVVNDLLPDDYLKHAPVRTYFRIISAAMFLLKTFALGGKEDEVAISLRLLDDTVRALRTSVVDDVHLCLRIADLLEGLTLSIRHKFVRLPPRPVTGMRQSSRTNSQTPAPYSSDNFQGNTQGYNSSDRFQYRTNTGDSGQNPLAGISRTYNNPYNSNISIMPPLGGQYTTGYNMGGNSRSYNQQQQQMYPSSSGDMPAMPSEEDWLTLDLQPLLDTSSLGGGENQWFGSFGPEAHNNLEVLGKLVNEPYRTDGYEPGDMGF